MAKAKPTKRVKQAAAPPAAAAPLPPAAAAPFWKVGAVPVLASILSLAAFFAAAVSRTEATAAWFDRLESHSFGVGWFRFSTLDFFGSALACFGYRERVAAERGAGRPWFETVACCTLLQFGGTTLVGLALGQPPSWACSHNAPRSLLLAWWLTFCCPMDAWHRAVRSSDALRLVLAGGAWLSAGHAVTSWGADKALVAQHAAAHGRTFLTLVVGTLGACGGSLVADAGKFYNDGGAPGHRAGFRKALVGSVAYYVLRDPHGAVGLLPFAGAFTPLSPVNARLAIGLYSVSASLPATIFASQKLAARLTIPHVAEQAVRVLLGVPASGFVLGAPPKAD
ncbi:hypothetical protein M885DRAFT_520355 [Pelagophyceae sp. CCMP2097]|nr:hypothetical protein M885DRAFT_520355 [Pelagophyceae sp. CCMP2097]|mmetsp:Transcript_17844/g.61299  ORF Transcript_17844/g.61299 Transcript_17844/m.61299 type:complete len:338 (-) Transcript_17844:2-1015(-)